MASAAVRSKVVALLLLIRCLMLLLLLLFLVWCLFCCAVHSVFSSFAIISSFEEETVEVLSKGSKWMLHTLVKAEPKFCMQLP